ncbi:MAG: DUF4349 domain-containing protein [Eubacterium sp.]|nr:DUF4349 domain-containing protein [Eubacterium sp.]
MKKRLSVILLTGLLSISLTLGGCGAGAGKNSSTDSGGTSDAARDDVAAAEDSVSTEMSKKLEAEDPTYNNQEIADMDSAEGGGESGALAGNTAEVIKTQDQKLIYTYEYTVETKEFDAFYKKVNDKTTQLGGYVERSDTDGNAVDSSNRYSYLVLRIPAEKMQQMLSLLDSDANITYQSCRSENVTLQYVDMESHVKALRTEQEALLKLMEKADKLKDIIALQSQLTQVRYEIESYESQLRMYDNKVDYSTLHLNITEVDRTTNVKSTETSFFDEISNGFSDNVYALGLWLRSLAVWLISSLPILVPLAVIVAALFFFIRRKSKNRRSRSEQAIERQDDDRHDDDTQDDDRHDDES